MLIFFITVILLAAFAAFFMSYRKLSSHQKEEVEPDLKLKHFANELLVDLTKLYEYVNHQRFSGYEQISKELYECIEYLQRPEISEDLVRLVDETLSAIESNLKERNLI